MKTNLWKWGVFGGVAIALFLLGRSCGVRSVVVKAGRIDTVYAKPDTIKKTDSIPKPYAVIEKEKDGKITIDTVFVDKPLPEDTVGVYNDYFRTYVYSYSDRVGPVQITMDDTISQNMFLGRGLTGIVDSVPLITKTVIIQQPKKAILYLGFSGYGNKNFGGGIDLSYKAPSDKIFGVGASFLGRELYYSVHYRIPIKLKKQ